MVCHCGCLCVVPSDRQWLHSVCSETRLQHVTGQTAADDSVWRQASDGEQHGDVHVHSLSACICHLRSTLRLDQRLSLNAFWIKQSDRSRSRQICWTRSIRSDEINPIRRKRILMFKFWPIIWRRNAKNREIRNNITKSVQGACHEVPHKICSFWRQKLGKNYTRYNYFTSETYCWWAWHCSLTSHRLTGMRHGRGLIKNLSRKSDFYQTRPKQIWIWFWTQRFLSGVDSERN